jgi:uncharacterized BrkB/YihY/UPF0761 family membrane protein
MEAQDAPDHIPPCPPETPPRPATPEHPALQDTLAATEEAPTSTEKQLPAASGQHTIEEYMTDLLHSAQSDARHLLSEAEEHEAVRVAITEAKTFAEFWLKLLNDWTLNFASGLSYNLLMALFPIIIALGAIVGFISGNLSPQHQQDLINRLGTVFPAVIGPADLKPALAILNKGAGLLGIVAIALALYSGSRLFVAMENYFAVIYHTPTRSYLRQNLMALALLLIFILLIPLMLFASAGGLSGVFVGLLASVLLFEIIYIVVPNQQISLRKSWRGTLVASIALQVYVAIFPLYTRHFLGSYTGNAGFAVILLLFFYYFALIILIGAEVNAFYAEDVRARAKNIAAMVHQATLEADKEELAQLRRQQALRRATHH